MKTKRLSMKIILALLIMLSVPTTASASLFYDLSGYSNVSWHTNGVTVYASSSTTDDVDLIQVLPSIYVNGSYYGFLINSANDDRFINVSRNLILFGVVQIITQHDAKDWTGDEQVWTDSTYYR